MTTPPQLASGCVAWCLQPGQPWKTARPNPSVFGATTWKLDIYCPDGSVGKYSQDATGWSTACLKQNAERKRSLHGPRSREDTRRRVSELIALVVLAETIETAGLSVVRVDAQFLLTLMGSPETASEAPKGTCL